MKKFVFVAVLLMLCVSVMADIFYTSDMEAPINRDTLQGVERITNYDPRINDDWVSMTAYFQPYVLQRQPGVGRGGYNPVYERGTARIKSYPVSGAASTYMRSSITLKTKDLIPSERIDSYYEVYFVDFDTNYTLSVGAFWAGLGGVAELITKNPINEDLRPYDAIVITAKPYFALDDPRPGPVVLIAPMYKYRDYYGGPLLSNMMPDTGFEVY